jgi:nicotinamide-nucleotide amidase
MPGVPREMKALTRKHLKQIIVQKYALPPLEKFILRTTGIAESRLFEKLEATLKKFDDIPISFLPKIIGVDLKLAVSRRPEALYTRTLKFVDEIRSVVGKYIYTEKDDDLAEILGHILRNKKLFLSVAESFTGGLISDWITNIPGSSDYYQGSVICYSNESKIATLGVKKSTLEKFGAVSEPTAEEMVRGVQKLFNSECAIATTGIAGPSGGSAEKPVGLCYIAGRYKEKQIIKKLRFGNERSTNKERGAMAGLEILRRLLLNIE